jgi:hypothetical protein
MSDDNLKSPHLGESPETEAFDEYRSVSGLAVFGLFLGFLSLLAFTGPAGWIVPLITIVVCLAALWRIHSQGENMIGHKAAVCGLILAVLFGAMSVSQWFSYRWMIKRQARGIASAWFDLLTDGQPMKAHQLTLLPTERKPLDGPLLHVYQRGPTRRRELDEFLAEPLVRTILALGKKADIRFYKCDAIEGISGYEKVRAIYSISFDDENGNRKTFFASVVLRRIRTDQSEKINWFVSESEGGIRLRWMLEGDLKNIPDDQIDQ